MKQERVIKYLLSKGCSEVESTSRKYRQFARPFDKEFYYFVGKNGAVRVGKNTTESFSITDAIEKAITKQGVF